MEREREGVQITDVFLGRGRKGSSWGPVGEVSSPEIS